MPETRSTNPPQILATATDRYRPSFHFTPQQNFMNDPNGLILHDGRYHLFFQHNPHGTEWGHMSWGHASSSDLFGWEEHPVALHEEDDLMMFSGSAVFDAGNSSGLGLAEAGPLVLAYTGHSDSRQIENQNLAFSNNGGLSFTKYAGNPVLDVGARDFRDPQVFWHEPTQRWIMVVGYRLRVGIYGSDDLTDWSPLSEFRPDIPDDSPSCECPQLLEVLVDDDPNDIRWMLAMSIAGSATAGGSGMLYDIGHFDGSHFIVTEPSPRPNWVDHGADFFAAQSFNGPHRNRHVWLGWMNNWRYAGVTPTGGWRGCMSLPREVSLTRRYNGLRLRQLPVPELERFRQKPRHLVVEAESNGAAKTVQVENKACDILATFSPHWAERFGVRLRWSTECRVDVGYDSEARTLYVDRTTSGNVDFHDTFPAVHTAPLDLDADGRLSARIVVDACSIEVFADDGTAVITDLVFPDADELGVETFSFGGRCSADVTVFPLAR